MKEGKKWETSPMDIARSIGKGFADKALISQVNGVLWDMSRPLESDCELKIFDFNTDEGRDTFWHSSAHILGEVYLHCPITIRIIRISIISKKFESLVQFLQALEQQYGCKLCIGPCTTRGEVNSYDCCES